MRYGLLGEKLTHSYSPQIYNEFGISDYRLFEVAPREVEGFLRRGNLTGLNITIPYKKVVLPFCDYLSDIASRLGNVNILHFDSQGKIYGDNTDYAGFCYLTHRFKLRLKGKKVLVLGSGSAAKTVSIACQDLGAGQVVMVSRRGENNYGNLHRHANAEVLVNATPVGMYPRVEEAPVHLDDFIKLEAVVDLVYNPLRTRLLLEARLRGIPYVNGLVMLIEQGRLAAETFLSRQIPAREGGRVYVTLLRTVENVALVGMPGSGKTSVARLLAAKMGRRFVDIDEQIQRWCGSSPAEIIVGEGEAKFRQVEGEVLQRLAKESGLIIATGGGAVLGKGNCLALEQNSRIYWLDRALSHLDLTGRPLSRDIAALDRRRRPLYQRLADVRIDVAKGMAVAANDILEEYYAYTSAQWA